MINNLINGNLSDARRQARRYSYDNINMFLLGIDWSSIKASAAANYLKHGGNERFQTYCDTDHVHQWGPIEHARLTGNPHRKCTGCDVITLDLEGS